MQKNERTEAQRKRTYVMALLTLSSFLSWSGALYLLGIFHGVSLNQYNTWWLLAGSLGVMILNVCFAAFLHYVVFGLRNEDFEPEST